MELFFRRLKTAFGKLFGFSFLIGFIVVLFMFSGIIFLNIKKIGAFGYVYLGDRCTQKQNYEKAILYYNSALQLYPGHVKARYNLGSIYAAYEDFDSAIESYQNVLIYDPNYINAMINMGIIYAEEKLNFDRAIEEYTKATQVKIPVINIPFIYDNAKIIKDEKAIAYYDMGLAYKDMSLLYSAGSLESRNYLLKAADCYQNSLELNPKNYDAQYNLALTNHLLGSYTEALEGYCRAMLIAPLNYEAYYNMAVLLRQRGQYKEAADEFRRAGNLVNMQGDSFKAAFTYGVLNEVSEMAIAQHGFESKKVMERLNTELGKETEDMLDAESRAITVDELEKVLIKRLKTCSVCKAYIEGE